MIQPKHKFFRRDNRIKADLVKLQKTLNVAKKEKEPRISRITGIFVHHKGRYEEGQ